VLYKIVVPTELAEDILIALRYEGVDKASLMPSLDNIAKSAGDHIKLHKSEEKVGL